MGVRRERVTALVEAHRSGAAGRDWLQDLARRFGALGVYGDFGGPLMVRPDGSVLGMGWDDEEPTAARGGWRLIGLAAASYRFPELADLAPERPDGARPCWKCAGPGCEYCFGMGWLPDNLG